MQPLNVNNGMKKKSALNAKKGFILQKILVALKPVNPFVQVNFIYLNC